MKWIWERHLAVVILSLLLLGCPPEQELSIYNNTGEDLVLLVGRARVAWKGGDVVRFGGDDGISWEQLSFDVGPGGVRAPQLSVEANGVVSIYRLALPGFTGDFLDRSTGLYRRALQIQADRKLYAVHVDSELPTDNPPPQPAGLPLMPQRPN